MHVIGIAKGKQREKWAEVFEKNNILVYIFPPPENFPKLSDSKLSGPLSSEKTNCINNQLPTLPKNFHKTKQ